MSSDSDLEGETPRREGSPSETEEDLETPWRKWITIKVKQYTCQKCGYQWIGLYSDKDPVRCPSVNGRQQYIGTKKITRGCGSINWMKPKKSKWRPVDARRMDRLHTQARNEDKIWVRHKQIEDFKAARKNLEKLAKEVLK